MPRNGIIARLLILALLFILSLILIALFTKPPRLQNKELRYIFLQNSWKGHNRDRNSNNNILKIKDLTQSQNCSPAYTEKNPVINSTSILTPAPSSSIPLLHFVPAALFAGYLFYIKNGAIQQSRFFNLIEKTLYSIRFYRNHKTIILLCLGTIALLFLQTILKFFLHVIYGFGIAYSTVISLMGTILGRK